MAIIGKSMFPLQNSIRNITGMKVRFDQLQLQLATGKKASSLAELGTDRFFDLSMRARLGKLESYADTMTTVNLRLDVLNSTMERFDVLESDQRALVTPGGYGSSGINLATAPELSKARLDEVLNLLNTSVDGRYLLGGSTTDRIPVADLQTVLNGGNGKVGFVTVLDERTRADLGDGLGRLEISNPAPDTVGLNEDGAHPFGFKLSTLRTNSTAVALTAPTGDPASQSVQFTGVPEDGETITIGLTLPDGTETTVTLTAGNGSALGSFATTEPGTAMASAASVADPAGGQLVINGVGVAIPGNADAATIAGLVNAADIDVTASVGTGADAGKLILTGDTPTTAVDITSTVAGLNLPVGNHAPVGSATAAAANFTTALQASLTELGKTTLAAASAFAASDNFFNGQGEPVLRVAGPSFATATELKVASASDTVFWYQGGTQGIKAEDMGRLTLGTTGAVTTLSEQSPVAADYGFRLLGATSTADPLDVAITPPAGNPSADNSPADSLTVAFNAAPVAGDTITVSIEQPNGATRDITLRAVAGPAATGEFSIGADNDVTAANFEAALRSGLETASAAAAGTARDSVRSQVDDGVHANYGVQANENGMLELVRTLAAMSTVTYPNTDGSGPRRFDAMAERNLGRLNEGHNNEPGSLEVIAVQLGLAQVAMNNISERHTAQRAQLDGMLSDLETAPQEEVAMEILALKTRLEASYQTTAMVAQMSLLNYL